MRMNFTSSPFERMMKEVPINGKTYLDIFLKEDTELLDEVENSFGGVEWD